MCTVQNVQNGYRSVRAEKTFIDVLKFDQSQRWYFQIKMRTFL